MIPHMSDLAITIACCAGGVLLLLALTAGYAKSEVIRAMMDGDENG